MKFVFAVPILGGAIATACNDADDRVIPFDTVGEGTTVAALRRAVTERPDICILFRGSSGDDAYAGLLRILAENLDVTPSPHTPSAATERFGQVLLDECAIRGGNRAS